ncbi:MAG TPA: hypothetical protein VGN55_07120 [Xanthobacteraceae bacterium]
MPRRTLQAGSFHQLNLYTLDSHGLPDGLFENREVNWHNQQFGRSGLIAAAGLWVRGSVVTITTMQSDVCQQLYRQHDLRKACKTRLETRFKYWYIFLLNAVLDAGLDGGISSVRSPTGRHIVAHTKKAIRPDLFARIYDHAESEYRCRRVVEGAAEYWEIPLRANAARIVRLRGGNLAPPEADRRRKICIFHDIEEDVDTAISPSECRSNLERMLRIEREFDVPATYCILGSLFDRRREAILAADSRHAIGFHSFDHQLADLDQLPKCREVDLRVRGYRPPQSRTTSELTDENLAFHNFEWLANSSHGFGFADCVLQNGIVKIPIHLDDYSLFTGTRSYAEWESSLLEQAGSRRVFGLGLHDCYAGKWLDRYPDLLRKLASLGEFQSADRVCDQSYLRAAGAIARTGGAAAFGRSLLDRMAGWLTR